MWLCYVNSLYRILRSDFMDKFNFKYVETFAVVATPVVKFASFHPDEFAARISNSFDFTSLLILILFGDSETNLSSASYFTRNSFKVLYANSRGLRTNSTNIQALLPNYNLISTSETSVTSNKSGLEFLITDFY